MKITNDSYIKMDFKIRLEDGTIAEDSSAYGKVFEFQLGDGIFSDKFESALIGLEIGSHKKVLLQPEDAFGEAHPAMIYQVPLQKFPENIQAEVGAIISFSQPNGTEMPGLIRELSSTEATVDFNHPLSGKTLMIEVNIKGVEEKRIN